MHCLCQAHGLGGPHGSLKVTVTSSLVLDTETEALRTCPSRYNWPVVGLAAQSLALPSPCCPAWQEEWCRRLHAPKGLGCVTSDTHTPPGTQCAPSMSHTHSQHPCSPISTNPQEHCYRPSLNNHSTCKCAPHGHTDTCSILRVHYICTQMQNTQNIFKRSTLYFCSPTHISCNRPTLT